MDALKISIDTLIVGALAAPWLLLIIFFFFPAVEEERNATGKGMLKHLLSLVGVENRGTVATVLLIAIVYLLGAGVARVAEDFFNDDDNPIRITENDIRASVYCDGNERQLLEVSDIGVAVPSAGKLAGVPACGHTASGSTTAKGSAKDKIAQIFQLQESALLLAGDDKVSRLRYIHQQSLVLRGSAFDFLITCLLCFFGWCATHGLRTRRVLAILPIGLVGFALYMLYRHWGHTAYDDPPSMEITLLAIGVVGCCLVLWKGTQPSRPYRFAFFLAALLAGLAYSGWWRTEIMYDRLVIDSFYAQSHSLLKLTQ